ncbi:hypothetical protein ABZ281_02410 [Streptomyces sp. NPDC006265]|uniref:hypothetical protein n=1 Tax=Streptomyces sp. NPDC006265 TaxID=3156740 RepID=UPI0033B0C87F
MGTAARRLGGPPGSVDRLLADVWQAASIGMISEQQMRARVSVVLGLSESLTDAFMDDLWADYLGSANEELIAYVRGLRSGCRLGILSNSFVGAREREERLYRLGDWVT